MWASRLASQQSVLFSNLQLLSGILYLAMLMVAGAAVSVTAHVAEFTDASFEDLAAVARLAELATFSRGRETIVVARSQPPQPTLGSQGGRALRRIRGTFERLWRARSS